MSEGDQVETFAGVDSAIDSGRLAAFRDRDARVVDSGMNHFHIEIDGEIVAMVRFTPETEAATRQALESYLHPSRAAE